MTYVQKLWLAAAVSAVSIVVAGVLAGLIAAALGPLADLVAR